MSCAAARLGAHSPQAIERDSPKKGFNLLVAHSTSGKEEKDKKKPSTKFGSHLPTFSSWTGACEHHVHCASLDRAADVFQTLVADGSKAAGMSAEDWVLSVLDEDLHCHAALLNAVIPGLTCTRGVRVLTVRRPRHPVHPAARD